MKREQHLNNTDTFHVTKTKPVSEYETFSSESHRSGLVMPSAPFKAAFTHTRLRRQRINDEPAVDLLISSLFCHHKQALKLWLGAFCQHHSRGSSFNLVSAALTIEIKKFLCYTHGFRCCHITIISVKEFQSNLDPQNCTHSFDNMHLMYLFLANMQFQEIIHARGREHQN